MSAGPSDQFEAQFMSDGSKVLHRDKSVSRRMAGLLAVPGLFTIALSVFVAMVNSTSDKPLPSWALPFVVAAMAAFGVGFLVMAVTFAVLRVVVTERDVHVKYGLWGPTIALAAITSCRVVDYRALQYGGWGIRRGADGSWAYVPAGARAVELFYTEDGTSKKVLVGAQDAAELARKIQQARAALAPKRIAAIVEERGGDAEEELAAEEAQEEEAGRADRGRRR